MQITASATLPWTLRALVGVLLSIPFGAQDLASFESLRSVFQPLLAQEIWG